MNSHKNTARIVGILFLLFAITGILGEILKDLPFSFAESPKYLKNIFENSFKIKISIFLDLIANVSPVGIAVILFPILKRLNLKIALWYFGFSVITFVIIVVGDISILSLLSISKEYIKANIQDSLYFQTLAILKQDEYFGAHFMSLIVFSLGAFMFYYLLYQSKLIPRFLSALGLIAVTLVLIATCVQIFGQSVSLVLYLPNGLFILFLATWLIAKGFNESALVSKDDKADTT